MTTEHKVSLVSRCASKAKKRPANEDRGHFSRSLPAVSVTPSSVIDEAEHHQYTIAILATERRLLAQTFGQSEGPHNRQLPLGTLGEISL